jgi:hypothetical protein
VLPLDVTLLDALHAVQQEPQLPHDVRSEVLAVWPHPCPTVCIAECLDLLTNIFKELVWALLIASPQRRKRCEHVAKTPAVCNNCEAARLSAEHNLICYIVLLLALLLGRGKRTRTAEIIAAQDAEPVTNSNQPESLARTAL